MLRARSLRKKEEGKVGRTFAQLCAKVVAILGRRKLQVKTSSNPGWRGIWNPTLALSFQAPRSYQSGRSKGPR